MDMTLTELTSKKGITMSSLGIELLTKYDTDRTKKGITMYLLGIELLTQKLLIELLLL